MIKPALVLQLFKEHGLRSCGQNLPESLSGAPMTDNRLVNKGDIFICIKGEKVDGHSFIDDAIARGAALIVCSDEPAEGLPAIRVKDTRKAAALLAKLYFDNPASAFRLVGITGTNGKTSTSLILFEALRNMGYKAGWIGTLGYKINDETYHTSHTTPDILELNRIFVEMRNVGATFVIMEVSSHGIALDRVYGIDFDYCIFTNFSRDHLDFHGSMEEYGKVKLSFFDQVCKGDAVAIINTGDAFGASIAANLANGLGAVFTFGAENAAYQIEDLECDKDITRFTLKTKESCFRLSSSLIGDFNATNLGLAAAALHLMSFDARDIVSSIASVKPVPGRLQSVINDQGIGVFVDYAHTPDAIETVLKTCRQLPHNRILCLMGAGGDRDQGKRPLMLSAALKHADAVIVTDDNPRQENPDRIIMDIISGSHPDLPWWIIRDRKLAIRSILSLANEGDLVVICGKGHEDYQEIEGQRHHFDDAEVAAEFLAENWQPEENALALPIDELLLRFLYGNPDLIPAFGYHQPRSYRYISTDTRSIMPGSIFFALKGERFDAHAFLGKALDNEANFAIGELSLPEHPRYLYVDSSIKAMARLHDKYLSMFDICKLALTGSTGKTGTKEIAANICSQEGNTLKTLANENNIIGLCQTIRRIRPQHRFGVFELGTSGFGEISLMSDTLKPDAAMLINIGPSHLAALGCEEGVYREKSTLLRRPLKIRLYDGDDPRFAEFSDSGKGVGMDESCFYRITDIQRTAYRQTFKVAGHEFSIPALIPYMVHNAAFGIAFALEKGFDTDKIQAGLEMDYSNPQRMEFAEDAGRLLIVDCYNANPVSMHKALEYWASIEPQRPHIAILGDMLELGEMSEGYHQMIGAILAEIRPHLLITAGTNSQAYHPQDKAYPGYHYPDADTAAQAIREMELPPDAVFLIKASRGIHLEKTLPAIKKGD